MLRPLPIIRWCRSAAWIGSGADTLATIRRRRQSWAARARRRILMERIWLKHYPPGVPADIDPSAYPSLVAMLEESFAKYRNDNAFVSMDKMLTYGELDKLSRSLGAWLQGKGVKQGARVALMMPNVL